MGGGSVDGKFVLFFVVISFIRVCEEAFEDVCEEEYEDVREEAFEDVREEGSCKEVCEDVCEEGSCEDVFCEGVIVFGLQQQQQYCSIIPFT